MTSTSDRCILNGADWSFEVNGSLKLYEAEAVVRAQNEEAVPRDAS